MMMLVMEVCVRVRCEWKVCVESLRGKFALKVCGVVVWLMTMAAQKRGDQNTKGRTGIMLGAEVKRGLVHGPTKKGKRTHHHAEHRDAYSSTIRMEARSD